MKPPMLFRQSTNHVVPSTGRSKKQPVFHKKNLPRPVGNAAGSMFVNNGSGLVGGRHGAVKKRAEQKRLKEMEEVLWRAFKSPVLVKRFQKKLFVLGGGAHPDSVYLQIRKYVAQAAANPNSLAHIERGFNLFWRVEQEYILDLNLVLRGRGPALTKAEWKAYFYKFVQNEAKRRGVK